MTLVYLTNTFLSRTINERGQEITVIRFAVAQRATTAANPKPTRAIRSSESFNCFKSYPDKKL